MIERLIRLGDLIFENIKAYEKQDRQKHSNLFIDSIVMCYLRFVETVILSLRIIAELRRYDKTLWGDEDGFTLKHYADNICRDLEIQSQNVRRLRGALMNLTEELNVLAPNIIKDWTWQLRDNYGDIAYLEVRLSKCCYEYQSSEDSDVRFTINGPLSKIKATALTEHLKSAKQQEKLEILKSIARKLREFIVSNFDSNEILWNIDSYEEEKRGVF